MKKAKILLTMLMAFVLAFSASAFVLDVAEEAVVLSSEEPVELMAGEVYGDLIFKEDFSSYQVGATLSGTISFPNKTPSWWGTKTVQGSTSNATTTMTVATPLDDGNRMLELKKGDGATGADLRLHVHGLGINKPGEYVIVLKYYVPKNVSMSFLHLNWREAENVSQATIEAGRGSVQTAVLKRTFSGSIGSLAQLLAYYPNGPWYIDSIEFYYNAPSVKIVKNDGTVNSCSFVAEGDTVTLPSDLGDTPAGTYLKGFTKGLNGELVAAGATYTVTADDIAAKELYFYPVYKNETYGDLVFATDFEGLTTFTNGAVITKTSAAYGNVGIKTLKETGSLVPTYETLAGMTNMLKLTEGGSYWNVFRFDAAQTFGKAGTYTFVADVYTGEKIHGFNMNINANKTVGNTATFDTKQTVSVSVDVDSFTNARILFTNAYAKTVYIDNVKVYYKDPGATVKFYNDNTTVGTTAEYKANAVVTLPTAEAMAAYAPAGTALKGFVKGVNGEFYAPGATYTVTEADASELAVIDFYPVYANATYGDLVFEADFEGLTTFTNGAWITSTSAAFGKVGIKVIKETNGLTAEYETVEGMTNMLKLTADADYWNVFRFDTASTFGKTGTYTLVADVYSGSKGVFGFNLGINEKKLSSTPAQAFGTKTAVQVVADLDLFELGAVTFANPDASYGFAKTVYLDNLKLYYNEPATTVAVNVYKDDTTVSTTTEYEADAVVTLPTADAMAEFAPAGTSLKGFVKGVAGEFFAAGATYTVTAAEVAAREAINFYPVYANATYGDLVFATDLEGLTTYTNGQVITKTSAAYGKVGIFVNKETGSLIAEYETVEGMTNMLKLTADGSYWNIFRFDANSQISKNGVYTFVADVYVGKGIYGFNLSMNSNKLEGNAASFATKQTVVVSANMDSFTRGYVNFADAASYGYAKTLYIDNVKLYYKEPGATVNVYNNDTTVGTKTEVKANDVVTLPTAEAMAAYAPAGTALKGFVKGAYGELFAPGSTYTVTEADASALATINFYPVFASAMYGDLVFATDFEGLTTFTNGAVITNTSAAYGNVGIKGIKETGSIVPEYETVDGMTNMLKLTEGGTYWNVFRFDAVSTFGNSGRYTFVADVYTGEKIYGFNLNINANKTEGNTATFATKQTVSVSVDADSFTNARVLFTNAYAKTVYIDNIKLYYREPSVVVNVHSDIATVADANMYIKATTVTLPTAEAMAKYAPANTYLEGFVKGAGGEFFAAGATYEVTADAIAAYETVDFYPVYKDAKYGELVFFEDFSGIAAGTVIVDANSKFASQKINNASMTEAFYDKNFSVTRGDYAVVDDKYILDQSSVVDVDGNNVLQITEKDNESNKYITAYIKGGEFDNLNMTKSGVYTIKYKVLGVESVDELVGFAVRAGSEAKTKEIYPTAEEKEDWIELTCTYNHNEGDTINYFILFASTTGEATTAKIYVDDIQLYYTEYVNVETVNATSIRKTGNSGLRFMSFASDMVRSVASEYGYLVAVNKSGETDEFYAENLVFAEDQERLNNTTLTNNGINFMCGMNYHKDTNIDVIYAVGDENLPAEVSKGNDGVYFTSVMTNIPAEGYDIPLVVRPYVVVNGNVYYGEVIQKSIYERAKELVDAGSDEEYYKEIVDYVESK